jgi:hypothetical protein
MAELSLGSQQLLGAFLEGARLERYAPIMPEDVEPMDGLVRSVSR